MDQFEVRLCGAGGQGLLLSARILAEALTREGKAVAQSQTYDPTSRGGLSRSDLVVSAGAVDYPLVTELDFLLVLDQIAVEGSLGLIKEGALVLVDEKRVASPPEGNFVLRAFPFSETAIRLGSERVANIVGLAALVELGGLCEPASLERAVREVSPERFLDVNLEAAGEGRAMVAAAAQD